MASLKAPDRETTVEDRFTAHSSFTLTVDFPGGIVSSRGTGRPRFGLPACRSEADRSRDMRSALTGTTTFDRCISLAQPIFEGKQGL